MNKILIKNGLVIDGSGVDGCHCDILIDNDRIVRIKKDIEPTDAMHLIDATGLIVAPGFIDTHSHSDLQVLLDHRVLPKVMQGITTEVLGQDGVSLAPLPRSYKDTWRKNLAGLDGDSDQIDWNFETTENYLAMIDAAKPAINECYLVPHGNVRMEAMGLDNRIATDTEIKRMQAIVQREMEAGAFGLSTGLIYIPCAFGSTKEIIEMCKIVASYDGVFVIHQRSEADDILSSMEEVIEIGKKSGVHIHYSHFKVCGKKNWSKIDQMIVLLEKAEEEGIQVTFDQYPYVAGSTMLGVILPPWVHDGGTDQLLSRLAEKKCREQIMLDMEKGIPGWDNFIDFAGPLQIFITNVKTEKNQKFVGCNLVQLGEKTGKSWLDATCDLLIEEENAVGMVDFYGRDEHVASFMKRKEMNVCTDGIYGKQPHPRLYCTYPRVIAKFVRDDGVLSLPSAIKKMTKKAATAMGIKNRGEIKEGNYADFCVFNYQKINDKSDFVSPCQYANGIEYVIVNGQIVVQHGTFLDTFPGSVLRRF